MSRRPGRPALLSGPLAAALLATGLAAIGVGFAADRARTWTDLLVDDFFFLSLALAGMVFLAINYLARAGWWVAIRRVPEAMMGFLPVGGLLMLPLFFGRRQLYPWSRAEAVARDPLLAAKTAYLNTPFFFLRMVAFLAIWLLFALAMRRASRAEDREGGLGRHRFLVRCSAGFVVAFAVSFSLAAFDWLMSVEPRWSSTLFAVYIFAGLFVQGLAAITLIVLALRGCGGPLAGAVHASHLHDLGKLLFAFSTFWAYLWLSQYLLIWYANIPREAAFYVVRTQGSWQPWFALVFVLGWVVPFLVLAARAPKRNPAVLRWISVSILASQWLNLFVIVAPAVAPAIRPGPLEALITAGYCGLFVLVLRRSFARAAPVALRDPFLTESLQHSQ
jgi:hypothetical protein